MRNIAISTTKTLEVVFKNIEILVRRRWIIILTFMTMVFPMLVNLLFFTTFYYPASAKILPLFGKGETSSLGLGATAALQVIQRGAVGEGSDATSLYEDILRSRQIVFSALSRWNLIKILINKEIFSLSIYKKFNNTG